VADSERIRVQRRRMVREGGVAKGRGSGMAQDWVVLLLVVWVVCWMRLTRSEGSLPEMVWFRAMTLYPTGED
jgi:hypothetical protein